MAKAKKKSLPRPKKPPKKRRRRAKPAPPAPYLPLPKPRVKTPEISLLRRMEVQFEKNLPRPKVSVVVVNRNGVDSLWHCLFSLKTQSYPAHEIILVDNASDDASLSFVRSNYPQVKILECQENFGFSMGVNLGAKLATGDLVALLGQDMVATPDWLARLVKDLQSNWPEAGAVSSLVSFKREPEGIRHGEYLSENFLGGSVDVFFADPRILSHPHGYAFLYARFLAAEGPFDSDYQSFQSDVYFGWKLLLLGSQVRRSVTAKVFHGDAGDPSPLPEWKASYLRTRNRWLNLFIFYRRSSLIKILPWILADMVVGQILSLVWGLDAFLGRLLALAWFLTHPGPVLEKRRLLQEKRRTADQDILWSLSGRLTQDKVPGARFLNFLSLAYCAVMGLEVREIRDEKERSPSAR